MYIWPLLVGSQVDLCHCKSCIADCVSSLDVKQFIGEVAYTSKIHFSHDSRVDNLLCSHSLLVPHLS